jgi:hypothetical protein
MLADQIKRLDDEDEGSISSDMDDLERATSSEGTTSGDAHESSRGSTAGPVIRAAENQAVRSSKRLVYAVMGVFALGTAMATWFFVRQEERNEFENEVRGLAACAWGFSFSKTPELTFFHSESHSTAPWPRPCSTLPISIRERFSPRWEQWPQRPLPTRLVLGKSGLWLPWATGNFEPWMGHHSLRPIS